MSLARTDYPNIDERLYSTVLENGLRVLVVPPRAWQRSGAS